MRKRINRPYLAWLLPLVALLLLLGGKAAAAVDGNGDNAAAAAPTAGPPSPAAAGAGGTISEAEAAEAEAAYPPSPPPVLLRGRPRAAAAAAAAASGTAVAPSLLAAASSCGAAALSTSSGCCAAGQEMRCSPCLNGQWSPGGSARCQACDCSAPRADSCEAWPEPICNATTGACFPLTVKRNNSMCIHGTLHGHCLNGVCVSETKPLFFIGCQVEDALRALTVALPAAIKAAINKSADINVSSTYYPPSGCDVNGVLAFAVTMPLEPLAAFADSVVPRLSTARTLKQVANRLLHSSVLETNASMTLLSCAAGVSVNGITCGGNKNVSVVIGPAPPAKTSDGRPLYANCDGDPTNGRETNQQDDADHCGSCKPCEAGQQCSDGVCTWPPCSAGSCSSLNTVCGTFTCNKLTGACEPKYAPSTTLCRSDKLGCAEEAYCTGHSIACPLVPKAVNTTCSPAGRGSGRCDAQGNCVDVVCVPGYSGDDCSTACRLTFKLLAATLGTTNTTAGVAAGLIVSDLAVGPDGAVYASTLGRVPRVWRIDPAAPHNVTLFAGGGSVNSTVDGASARRALLNAPRHLAVDPRDGSLLISDAADRCVRRVSCAASNDTSSCTITTVVSSADLDSQALDGQTPMPMGIVVAQDEQGWFLLIADRGSHKLLRRNLEGNDKTLSTYAGTGTHGSTGDGQHALSAELGPVGAVGFCRLRNCIYVLAAGGVRRIDVSTKIISAFAGTEDERVAWGDAGDGGSAADARFDHPLEIAIDAGGIIIADTNNNAIRRVDADSGVITTIAGATRATTTTIIDKEPALTAPITAPRSVVADSSRDRSRLVVADGNGRVYEISC